MEPEKPPTKHPRIAHGTEWRKVNGSMSINGVGEVGCAQTGHGIGGNPKRSGFTFMQIRELQHQTLIYKYMEAGIPVPYHLIFPIWKSMTYSLTGLTGSGRASLLSNYRNKMEAEEAWRCRRTDGKKWRCAKNVVPDHKYCQRHLHRGRTSSSLSFNNPSSSSSTSSHHVVNHS